MIPLPDQFKIIEKKKNYGRFGIKPLYPGYGTIIGVSLRKVLLSSLQGSAITEVRIKGVQHEFSVIDGVLEDVLHILMNLKQLRFRLFSEEPQKAILRIKGEREVKGQDLKIPSQLELVNPQAHIAFLTDKKAELEMEVKIEKGIGYQQERDSKEGKLEIGVLPLDAIFTPIKKVNYRVENIRVQERTDFDNLTIGIETDGTISPQEALFKASGILIQHFSLINDAFKETGKKVQKKGKRKVIALGEKKELPAEKKDLPATLKKFDKMKIKDLKISARVLNALFQSKINNVSDLIRREEEELLTIKGVGKRGIKEIQKALKKVGGKLR